MRTQLLFLIVALVLSATYIMASNNDNLDVDMDLMSEQAYDGYYSNQFSLMASGDSTGASAAFSNAHVSPITFVFMALTALIALFIRL